MFKHFQAALMMFSRLPFSYQTLESDDFKQSLIYLPLVGLVIGLFCAAVYSALLFFLPTNIALFFALVSGVMATGALHEDGFADCCDGFFASGDKDTILRIMRDSTNGSYATLGLIVLFAAKLLLLLSLFAEQAVLTFIVMHVFARFVPLWIVNSIPHCNSGQHKMSADLNLNRSHLYGALTFTSVAAWLFLSLSFVLLLLVCLWILSKLLQKLFMHKLGGYNGDCLGAGEQLAEVLILLLFVVSL